MVSRLLMRGPSIGKVAIENPPIVYGQIAPACQASVDLRVCRHGSDGMARAVFLMFVLTV